MNKFRWTGDLPRQIKLRLDITLEYGWSRIPTEINKVLRDVEEASPSCYATQFKPNHKTNWGRLLRDLDKLEQVLEC
jgi:hypothetical protein